MNFLQSYKFQLTVDSQTGETFHLVLRLVVEELKHVAEVVPIHHRQTVARIALDPEQKLKRATTSHVQVRITTKVRKY